jgi:hypothetical protein
MAETLQKHSKRNRNNDVARIGEASHPGPAGRTNPTHAGRDLYVQWQRDDNER